MKVTRTRNEKIIMIFQLLKLEFTILFSCLQDSLYTAVFSVSTAHTWPVSEPSRCSYQIKKSFSCFAFPALVSLGFHYVLILCLLHNKIKHGI